MPQPNAYDSWKPLTRFSCLDDAHRLTTALRAEFPAACFEVHGQNNFTWHEVKTPHLDPRHAAFISGWLSGLAAADLLIGIVVPIDF